ncbi:MAG: hypothetical protein LUD71_05945 [Clostridiales bacterium]|nr:hypothetical protein [Clostridiales bacterium]
MSDTVVANLSGVRTYFMMMVGAFVAGLISDRVGSRIKFMQWAFLGMAVFATVYVAVPAGGSAAIYIIVANFVCFGLCLYSIKALYFSTIDEVFVPKALAGTASGIISLLTYLPEMFLYTVSGNMVDRFAETATPLAGYKHCFTAMVILSAIGFVCGIILVTLNKKVKARMVAAGEL